MNLELLKCLGSVSLRFYAAENKSVGVFIFGRRGLSIMFKDAANVVDILTCDDLVFQSSTSFAKVEALFM